MQLTPSREIVRDEIVRLQPGDDALRTARAAVLDGRPIPVLIQEKLWARGIDVSALEQRLVQTQVFRQ